MGVLLFGIGLAIAIAVVGSLTASTTSPVASISEADLPQKRLELSQLTFKTTSLLHAVDADRRKLSQAEGLLKSLPNVMADLRASQEKIAEIVANAESRLVAARKQLDQFSRSYPDTRAIAVEYAAAKKIEFSEILERRFQQILLRRADIRSQIGGSHNPEAEAIEQQIWMQEKEPEMKQSYRKAYAQRLAQLNNEKARCADAVAKAEQSLEEAKAQAVDAGRKAEEYPRVAAKARELVAELRPSLSKRERELESLSAEQARLLAVVQRAEKSLRARYAENKPVRTTPPAGQPSSYGSPSRPRVGRAN